MPILAVSRLRLPCLLLCFVLLQACSSKGSVSPSRPGTPPAQKTIKDLRVFPQNLMVYAKASGEDSNLLSPAEQEGQDARFNRLFFGPWGMGKASIKVRELKQALNTGPRGYKNPSQSWESAEWDSLRQNANLAHYPAMSQDGITVAHTNLRELPTRQPSYSKLSDAQQEAFDDFQYSSLALGTPVFITHISRDRQWYYVETPLTGGWLPVRDVATVDEAFIQRYRNGRYAALIRDNVSLINDRGLTVGQVHVGALFPVQRASDSELTVLIPVRTPGGDGSISTAKLTDAEAVIKPLPLLPKLLAVVGNQMMGQPYGWGGMKEERDCSSTTRDLFTPFGLWLPRNSRSQAKAWSYRSVENLPASAKEQTIKAEAIPFATLLWMRGHVGLYVGKFKGQAAFFHNVWGVRVEKSLNNEEGRHVIGHCVVTSLEPGKELPDALPDGSLLYRIRGFSTVPGATR